MRRTNAFLRTDTAGQLSWHAHLASPCFVPPSFNIFLQAASLLREIVQMLDLHFCIKQKIGCAFKGVSSLFCAGDPATPLQGQDGGESTKTQQRIQTCTHGDRGEWSALRKKATCLLYSPSTLSLYSHCLRVLAPPCGKRSWPHVGHCRK